VRFSDEDDERDSAADDADDAVVAGNGDLLHDEDLDEEFDLGDGTAQTEATIYCPYCGEAVQIGLDPGGGETQEYIEDCQVCCRPMQVVVTYQQDGSAEVWIDRAEGD
jgi:hypothetical protein